MEESENICDGESVMDMDVSDEGLSEEKLEELRRAQNQDMNTMAV